FLSLLHQAKTRRPHRKLAAETDPRKTEHLLPKIVEIVDGRPRFHDKPPLFFHPPRDGQFEQEMHHLLRRYRETLQEDRRALLDHQLADVAVKAVGVGSIGTRCAVLLMMADDDNA